ncbi:MAG: sulfatase, partial [Pirellulaceae bacterium]
MIANHGRHRLIAMGLRITTNTALMFLLGYALCVSVAISAERSGNAPSDARPNILFAFADDWGRYASAYAQREPGGPSDIMKTPNFDRVAEQGVLFTNAFVNAPSCTPCRSSILSGQYFWRTGLGAILQGAIWDDSIPSYPLILRDAGYHIGHTYKVWSPGTPRDAPYGGRPYAYVRRGGHLNGYSQFVSGKSDHQAAKQQVMDEVLGNFRDFLADRDDRPFCYWFGPTNTHRKWTQGSGKNLWGLDPDDLKGKLPSYLPDVPIVREDFCDYLGEAQAFDASLGVLLDELERRGELDRTLVVVSGDHGIPGFPRGKCNLYDLGVGVALAIRWPSRVPAGRVVDDFVCLPDLAPTFLEAAGLTPLDVMTGRSLMEVLSSEKSGIVDPSRDHVIVGRERHVAAARHGHLPYPQRAIRTKDFLYIRNFQPDRWPMGIAPGFGLPEGPQPSYERVKEDTFAAFADLDASPTKAWILAHQEDPGMEPCVDFAFGRRPAEELYDVRKDPFHMKNVAADPDYASAKKQVSTRLLATLRETGDPRVIGDGT